MRKEQTNSLNLGYIKVKEEAKQEISLTDITIRKGINQIAEIEEFNLVVEFNMDRITEVDWGIDRAIGMTV